MKNVEFIAADISNWAKINRLTVGANSSISAPNAYIGVSDQDEKICVIEIHAREEYICFKSLKIHNDAIVIGYGESVHFIDLLSRHTISIKLDRYFGALYTPEEFELESDSFHILVASCEYLHHFTFSGDEIWKSEQLGIDGVVVQNVEPPYIEVAGEWDPPGGWENSKISLKNGVTAI